MRPSPRQSILVALVISPTLAYDNGAPYSRLPPLGWSSWVALGEDAKSDTGKPPEFDFCDEASVLASIDAFVSDEVGLYAAANAGLDARAARRRSQGRHGLSLALGPVSEGGMLTGFYESQTDPTQLQLGGADLLAETMVDDAGHPSHALAARARQCSTWQKARAVVA